MHVYYSQRISRKGICIFVHKCTSSALFFHLMMFHMWLLDWTTLFWMDLILFWTQEKMQLIPSVSHTVWGCWAVSRSSLSLSLSKQVSVCSLHGGLIQSDPNRYSSSPSLVTYTKSYLLSCTSLTLFVIVDQQTKLN